MIRSVATTLALLRTAPVVTEAATFNAFVAAPSIERFH
jgi:hypothetical protein